MINISFTSNNLCWWGHFLWLVVAISAAFFLFSRRFLCLSCVFPPELRATQWEFPPLPEALPGFRTWRNSPYLSPSRRPAAERRRNRSQRKITGSVRCYSNALKGIVHPKPKLRHPFSTHHCLDGGSDGIFWSTELFWGLERIPANGDIIKKPMVAKR